MSVHHISLSNTVHKTLEKKVRIIIFVYKHIINVNNILKAILLTLMLGR